MRITSANYNYTNQKAQKNDTNFGMFRIDKPMSQYISTAAKLGQPVEKSLLLGILNRFFRHLRIAPECEKQINQLMERNPDVYHTVMDRTLIQNAHNPLAKAEELVKNATTYTTDDIDKAITAPHILKAEADLSTRQFGGCQAASNQRQARAQLIDLKRVALMELFSTMERK